MIESVGLVGIYVLLVGVGSYLEKPLSRELAPLDLNLLVQSGAFASGLVAFLVVHGFHMPRPIYLGFGCAIGIVYGIGLLLYVFSLDTLRVSVASAVSNAYIAVTAVLGIAILGETVTVVKLSGFVLTLVGVLLLTYRVGDLRASGTGRTRLLALADVGGFVLCAGLSTFLEKPALAGLDPLGLNALNRLGQLAVAAGGSAVRHRTLSSRRYALGALGVGVMFGVGSIAYYGGLGHLPVSVAAALSNTWIVITLAMSSIATHSRPRLSVLGGCLVVLIGVTLLAIGA